MDTLSGLSINNSGSMMVNYVPVIGSMKILEEMCGLHQSGRHILQKFDREGSVELHGPIITYSGKIYDNGSKERGYENNVGNVGISFVHQYSHNDGIRRRDEEGENRHGTNHVPVRHHYQ